MEHGTRSAYDHGCRCDACTQTRREQWRTYYRSCGRYYKSTPNVDPAPIAEHVAKLQHDGMSQRAIAAAAGIGTRTLWAIVHGQNRRGIQPTTAAAILAVKPAPTLRPMWPYTRRVRALSALGWRRRDMAARTGLRLDTIGRVMYAHHDTVLGDTAERLTRLYDELSMKPGPSARLRAEATVKGWAPPLAWNDIDDPDEVPDVGAQTSQRLDLEEWLWLVRSGEDPERAAQRLGVQLMSVVRSAERHGRSDVASMARQAGKKAA